MASANFGRAGNNSPTKERGREPQGMALMMATCGSLGDFLMGHGNFYLSSDTQAPWSQSEGCIPCPPCPTVISIGLRKVFH